MSNSLAAFLSTEKKSQRRNHSEHVWKKYNRSKRSSITMENVAILKQPEMEPLGFVTSLQGTALFIFNKLWKFLNPDEKEFSSLIAIGADGTNVNTGCDEGIIRLFDLRIQRNLHWLICLLHLNELGIKHVIFEIDGRSLSITKLCGEIGRRISAE